MLKKYIYMSSYKLATTRICIVKLQSFQIYMTQFVIECLKDYIDIICVVSNKHKPIVLLLMCIHDGQIRVLIALSRSASLSLQTTDFQTDQIYVACFCCFSQTEIKVNALIAYICTHLGTQHVYWQMDARASIWSPVAFYRQLTKLKNSAFLSHRFFCFTSLTLVV